MDTKKRQKGDLFTWGWNHTGQLACGKIGGHSGNPSGTGIKKQFLVISSQYNFAVGITSSGEAFSWGEGNKGQLGHGDTSSSGAGKQIDKLKKDNICVTTGSSHALLLKGHELYTWGCGDDGRLGTGNDKSSNTPVLVSGFDKSSKITHIACGSEHSAVICGGKVFTWGKGEGGRLGHGSESNENKPKAISTLAGNAKEVACGNEFTVVLMEDGNVFAFGNGDNGKLGVGKDSKAESPQLIEELSGKKIISISTGHDHTLAISQIGDVYSWGYGGNGRLGHGSEEDVKKPKIIEALRGKGVTEISGGGYHSAAVTSKGELYIWGWNHFGQLGFEGKDTQSIPVPVTSIKKKVHSVSCGEGHTIVIAS